MSDSNLSYYQKNREKILQKNKENKEKIKAYYRQWYSKNKERVLEQRRNKNLNKPRKQRPKKILNEYYNKPKPKEDTRGTTQTIELEMTFI